MSEATFKVRDYLSPEEIQQLTERSDLKAAWILVLNWAMIIGAFALASVWPNPLTILVSIIILANRQLGLGILTHECAHNSFFKSKAVNRFVGRWLCGAPSMVDLDGYRAYHLEHHKKAGTDQDPDYVNYRAYPISRSSLMRKIRRDLIGVTGLKNLAGLMLMYMGVYDYDLSYKPKQRHTLSLSQKLKNFAKNAAGPLSFQVVLLVVLVALDQAWLFLLWWAAFLTVYGVFARLRNAGEHAAVPDLLDPDPRVNTRTTLVSWWERLTVAPNHVNYHLEHHMLASVPSYNLARMHQMLKAKGALDSAEVVEGYPEVVRRMTAVA